MLGIVLVEPEIPQNTGNIARTCAVTGSVLHLVGPLGFEITDKQLKRAGLDYWHLLDVRYYDSLEAFWEKNPNGTFFYATSKGQKRHTDVTYPPDSYLMFGKETKGLPERMIQEHPERCVRIPMRAGARCLNLSNSVAVLVYEALRQNDFEGLLNAGPFPQV